VRLISLRPVRAVRPFHELEKLGRPGRPGARPYTQASAHRLIGLDRIPPNDVWYLYQNLLLRRIARALASPDAIPFLVGILHQLRITLRHPSRRYLSHRRRTICKILRTGASPERRSGCSLPCHPTRPTNSWCWSTRTR
jgi:hypothetical protein